MKIHWKTITNNRGHEEHRVYWKGSLAGSIVGFNGRWRLHIITPHLFRYYESLEGAKLRAACYLEEVHDTIGKKITRNLIQILGVYALLAWALDRLFAA